VHTHTHAYVHTHAYAHAYAHTHAHAHTCARTRAHAHYSMKRAHTRTHTCKHTHTHALPLSLYSIKRALHSWVQHHFGHSQKKRGGKERVCQRKSARMRLFSRMYASWHTCECIMSQYVVVYCDNQQPLYSLRMHGCNTKMVLHPWMLHIVTWCMHKMWRGCGLRHGMATISRLPKNIGLFCKRAL